MARLDFDQARLRQQNVTERIGELKQLQTRAAQDAAYYGSLGFRRSVASEPASALRAPARTPEEYQALRRAMSRDADVASMLDRSRTLPESTGSRLLQPHRTKVALLCDALLFDALDGTADIRYLDQEGWRDTLDWAEVLLVASTWRGRFDDWHGATGGGNPLRMSVIPYCREHGIPVIFYSKEDPPNYDRFLALAREADYIVTSDDLKIPDYHRDCPDALGIISTTFGVSPRLHHPVGSRRIRDQRVLFAGSWLAHKYPKRRISARGLFDGVLEADRDLLILDRNSALGDPRYHYPQEYLGQLAMGVDHDDLMRLQRTVDVHLNLNSVSYSPTMFANRVVELLAMGGLVLSNYSMAVNDLFPEVQLIDQGAEVAATLDAVSSTERYRTQMSGVQRAWSSHTAHARMADILRSAGFDTHPAAARVAVVADQVTPEIQRMARLQSTEVAVLSSAELRDRREHFDVVVPFDSEYRYGRDHVAGLVNGFAYTASDAVTRLAHEAAGEIVHDDEHEFVTRDRLDPGRSALWLDSEAGRRYLQTRGLGGDVYAIDPFGVDISARESVHLSEPTDPGLEPIGPRTEAPAAAAPGDPVLTVVVPVYNNGRFLEHKCFRSLQRSSIFDQMEILLIDDGSTDGETPQIVEDLVARYPERVRGYANPRGGSGSASRPRNQGLAMARAPFITYLDPDNEAVEDGYAELLDLVRRTGADFAIGNMLKLAARRWKVDNTAHLRKHLPVSREGGLTSPPDALTRIGFQPMSIQALVAQTGWLRSIGMHQPVGALGQDSYAFQQMLHGARRLAVTDTIIHVYYGAVSNSMVNTVGPGFFAKYVPMEEARVAWLHETGLYDDYCAVRAKRFLAGWILGKLNRDVAPEHLDECRQLVRRLASFYAIELEETTDEQGKPILAIREETAADPTADPRERVPAAGEVAPASEEGAL